jgi:hypothetical protein
VELPQVLGAELRQLEPVEPLPEWGLGGEALPERLAGVVGLDERVDLLELVELAGPLGLEAHRPGHADYGHVVVPPDVGIGLALDEDDEAGPLFHLLERPQTVEPVLVALARLDLGLARKGHPKPDTDLITLLRQVRDLDSLLVDVVDLPQPQGLQIGGR